MDLRPNGSVLVVDDDLDMLALLEAALSAAGFDVAIVRSAEGGLLALQRTRFDVVMSDINLPGMSGLEFCSHVVSDNPEQAVMVMTAFGSMKAAIDAMRAGAYDFIVKPVDLDAVTLRLARIVRDVRTRDEARRLRQVVEGARSFGNIIGSSTEMQRTYDLLARVSPSDASALVTGESGTGKELVARALHEHGPRRNGPFVAVNC